MAYTNGMMFPVTALEGHRHPTLDTPVKRGDVYDAGDRITAEHMRGLSLVLLGDHEATVLPHPEEGDVPALEWQRNEPAVLQALLGFKFVIEPYNVEQLTDEEIQTVEAFIHDQHAWEGGADTNPPAPPASIHAFSPQGIAAAAEKAEQDRIAAEAKAKEEAEAADAKAKEDAAKAEAAEAEKKALADAEAAKAAAAKATQAPAASKPAAKRTRGK